MAIAETATVLTDAGIALASMGESVRAALGYEPWSWLEAADWGLRRKKLKDRYGKYGTMPKKWSEVPGEVLTSLHPDVLVECEELIRLGLEPKAIRLAYCRKLGHVWECPECGRPAKKISTCRNRMCVGCAQRNFDALFKRFLQVDELISASVRSLSGWTWNVLDFSFRHDGDFPEQWELRAMVRVIRRTVQRAVREAVGERCRKWYDAGRGCRLRLNDDGSSMMSANGWPIAGAPDGEARELVGWTAVYVPEHVAPDNEARKRGEHGAKKKIAAAWKLRFGYELLRITEFGFDNVNAHFHCAYFGPRLDYWKNKESGRLVCGGRLVEIFKEESRRPVGEGGLGEESYTVFYERERHGFRSVLAHALKYTEKIPASTPEGLAQLEKVLEGTRRVALLGAHYGVPLKPKPRDPKCPSCGAVMGRVEGLGLVPLSEISDLPDVVEEGSGQDVSLREPGADEFLEEEVRGP